MEAADIAKVLEPLASIPPISVAFVALAAIGWFVIRYLDRRGARIAKQVADKLEVEAAIKRDEGKQLRAATFSAALDKLAESISRTHDAQIATAMETKNALNGVTQAVQEMKRAIDEGVEQSRRLSDSQDETADAVKALVAANRGAMSAEDSRRLIFREMESLRKEVFYALCASLRKNHYADDPEGVINKLKGGLTAQFDKAVGILRQYDLAISFDAVMNPYKNENGATRYRIVDDLCAQAISLYKSPADYNDRTQAEAQDQRTYGIVKQVFRDAYNVGMESALSAYTKDPISGQHPISRQSGADWNPIPASSDESDVHRQTGNRSGLYRPPLGS